MRGATDHIAVGKLLDREQHTLRNRFHAMVGSMRRNPGIVEFAHDKDVNSAVQLMEPSLRWFTSEIASSFARCGQFEALRLRGMKKNLLMKAPQVDIGFDAGSKDAASIMADSALSFIRDFTADQRATLRAALSDALQRGSSPERAARAIRDSIGLTAAQTQAVATYRNLLERGSSQALDRQLRDARYDSTVTNANERGNILRPDQVDRMVSRYADNMLAWRADTIARTESHRALSQGRYQALAQLADQQGIDDSDITRTWNATKDKRTRDTHAEMDGQQVTGFEPFKSPNGADIQFPGDPSAPPEETINCRCVETYDVATPAEEE